jgi:hypothetical protein
MTHLLSVVALLLAPDQSQPQPLPDAARLRQMALTNMRDAAQALEKYSCAVSSRTDQVDENGGVKKTESRKAERFFVNGVQVDHVLERNGKALEQGAQEKEQRRTDREVKKYSEAKQAQKVEDEREKRLEMFLRVQRLVRGQRQLRGGRKTLLYDMEADPNFRPKNLDERFAQAAGGRIWIDEESGAPVELKMETSRDVKIGGGLLANLHKGFQLHFIRLRQADGLWLTKMVEGNADLRAGLFFHPRLRFREETSNCQLYSVDSKDAIHGATEVKP